MKIAEIIGRAATPLGAAVITVLASPAFAEVCDKERPDWEFTHGPASSIDASIGELSSSRGLVVLALVAVGLLLPGRWLYLPASLLVLYAAILSARLLGLSNGVYHHAVAEGCIGSPLPLIIVLLSLGAALAWHARRRGPAGQR